MYMYIYVYIYIYIYIYIYMYISILFAIKNRKCIIFASQRQSIKNLYKSFIFYFLKKKLKKISLILMQIKRY